MEQEYKRRDNTIMVLTIIELLFVATLLFAPLRRLYLGMIGIGLGILTLITFFLSIKQWKQAKPYQPKVNSNCYLATNILAIVFNAWVCVHSVYVSPTMSSVANLISVIGLCAVAIVMVALDISAIKKPKEDKK